MFLSRAFLVHYYRLQVVTSSLTAGKGCEQVKVAQKHCLTRQHNMWAVGKAAKIYLG